MLLNPDRHTGTILHDQNGDQRYVLQNRLGAGGKGTVYRGLDRRDQRLVAIKVVESTISSNHVAEFAKEGGKFQQEVLTLQGLKHPHIVPLLGSGVDRQSELFYLVMDIAEGGSLRERIKKLRHLPPSETVLHIHQAASALQWAHDHHTIHMDVKPDNFLLKNADGSWILVSDFGIAGVKHDPKSVVTAGFQGTLEYASPEQLRGKPTKFTDQWSLAFIGYEALTGVRPFQKADIFALATGQLIEPPKFLDLGITDALHVKLEGVLRRGLKKEQEERYPEVIELAKALEEIFLIVASDPEKRIFLAAKLPSLPNVPQEEHDLYSAPTVPNAEVARLIEQARKEINSAKAIQMYDQVLTLDPKNTDALLGKALLLTCLRRYLEALKMYDQLLSLDPKNIDALWGKAVLISYEQAKYEEALHLYNQILSINPQDRDALAEKANLLHNLIRYEEEIHIYDQLIARDKTNQHLVQERDTLHSQWEKFKKLLQHENFNPHESLPLLVWMSLLVDSGKRDEAKHLYVIANNFVVQPDSVSLYRIKALEAMSKLGKSEEVLHIIDNVYKLVRKWEADKLYETANNIDIQKASERSTLLKEAKELSESGRNEEALYIIEKVFGFLHKEYRIGRGILSEYQEGMKYGSYYKTGHDRPLRLRSTKLKGLTLKAKVLHKMKRFMEEVETERVLHHEQYFFKGCGRLEAEDEIYAREYSLLKGALQDYDNEISVNPQNSDLLDGRNQVLRELEELDEVIQKELRPIEEAIRLNPHDSEALRHKGEILEFYGRDEEAQEAYARAEKLEQQKGQELP